jgi:hypothetical protein
MHGVAPDVASPDNNYGTHIIHSEVEFYSKTLWLQYITITKMPVYILFCLQMSQEARGQGCGVYSII